MILAFLLVGLRPGVRWRAWVAMIAWIFGFEGLWQVTQFVLSIHNWATPSAIAQAISWAVRLVDISLGWIVAAYLAGIRVDWRWLLPIVPLWGIWVATGFHSNWPTSSSFDGLSEALNEGTKTLWGLAYLWPLIPTGRLWKPAGKGVVASGAAGS